MEIEIIIRAKKTNTDKRVIAVVGTYYGHNLPRFTIDNDDVIRHGACDDRTIYQQLRNVTASG